MVVVDTNVLLYAANSDAREHKKCRAQLLKLCKGNSIWFLSWGIVYEFLRVATHPRVLSKPLTGAQAWAFISSLLNQNARLLVPTERHAEILAELVNQIPELKGNLLFDARTSALMKEHGVQTIYTRDMDFNLFPWVEIVDPLSGVRRRS